MMVTSIVLAVLAQVAASAQAGKELSGVVVDAQGRPAAGVEVLLSSLHRIGGTNPTLGRTTTDAQGRFRHAVPASSRDDAIEIWTLWASRPGTTLGVQAVGAGEGLARLDAPLKLTLGPPRTYDVQVLAPDGRPVDGARVCPMYCQVHAQRTPISGVVYSLPIPRELLEALSVRTDARGTVELAGLPPDSGSFVRVETKRFGTQSLMLSIAKTGPAIARLAPVGGLIGRVKGDNPAAAAGLTIRVESSSNGPNSRVFAPDGHAEVRIDATGRFEVPALAVGKLRLSLNPRDGQQDRDLPAGDRAIEPGKITEITITLAGLNRIRTVDGRVVDRQGQPVAGAVVFQSGDGPKRTRTTTDGQGRFQLVGVDEGLAFLFAEKVGFRFHGRRIDETPGAITLTLTRTGEKPVVALRTRPSRLPHEEELALARRVLDAHAEKVLKGGNPDETFEVLQGLARVEPERVLAEAEKGKDPALSDSLRWQVVQGMAHEDPVAAAEVAETIGVPMVRALAYVTIGDTLGPTPEDRARRLALLDQALLHARGEKEADKRLACLGLIADHWLDLGERDKAAKLLREGERTARELPNAAWAGYARGAFAEELAQIDLAAALALIKDLSDPGEFDRHHANIAHELAGKDPAAAERVLAMVREPWYRGYGSIRVCYRMAPVDLARARRIAGAIEHTLMKPYALGLMAQALAGSEQTRHTAAELLAAAFAELTKAVDAGTDVFNNMESAAVTAATLLPVAEAIDPALVPEYLWRSLSFRRPTPGPGSDRGQGGRLDQASAGLAMRLARYDPDLAHSLLDPIARRMADDPMDLGAVVGREVIVALGLIDPKRAVALLEQLPDAAPDTLLHQTRERARLELAAMFTRPGERRWKYLQGKYFPLWVPDVEDIGGES